MKNNKALLFVLAILIFIPSIVGIYAYTQTETAPIETATAGSIIISDLSGKVTTLEKKTADDEATKLIDFFLSLNSSSTKVAALPDPLMGTAFFKVDITAQTKTDTYQYYFSTNPAECYYVDNSGTAYQIKAEDAEKFIKTEYAASLYTQAVTPTMTLSGTTAVKPTSATWKYKNYAGEYAAADTSALLAAQTEKYDLEGGFDITYDTAPDYLALKIINADDGTVLFDDLYENLTSLNVDKATPIAVEATAKWYEDAERDYFGEMSYKFETNLSAPAEFFLGETEIQPGEFVVISAKNVKSPDKISMISEPDISYTPTWYADGEYVHALVPINMELTAGTYKFTLSYAGFSQDVNLTVTARSFGEVDSAYSSAVIKAAYTEETLKTFNDTLLPIAKAGSATRYWDGIFVQPNLTLTAGYGRYINITTTGETFRHTGVDYSCSEGTEITAVNTGVVVYAGYTDYAGFMVVVEHGYGLKSWYALLKECSVAVGDNVAKGDVVGLGGDTGFTIGNRVHIGLSVFDVPVCTYWINENPIPMYAFTE